MIHQQQQQQNQQPKPENIIEKAKEDSQTPTLKLKEQNTFLDHASEYDPQYSDDDEDFQQLCKGVECYDKSLIINPEQNQEFIDENTCPVCLNLIKDTCQCQFGCQQLFGYECVKHQAIQGCPFCRKNFDSQKMDYRNDKIAKMQKDILKLKCQNHENGCPEQLEYYTETIQTHQKSCLYKSVKCKNYMQGCKWQGIQKDLNEHLPTCEYKFFQCKFCKSQKETFTPIMKKDLQAHLDSCQNKLVSDLQKQIENHLQQTISLKEDNKENIQNEQNFIENNSKQQLKSQQQDLTNINEIFQQTQKVLKTQQEKIKFLNEQMDQLIKYSSLLEPDQDKQRDNSLLLNDFKKGLINFNSLESLKKIFTQIDSKFIKGVRWNENNLQCYQFSFRSNSNFKPIIKKIQDFAESGDKFSQYSLARLYIFGDKDISRNVDKALHWVNQSIEQNCPEGKYLLGRIQHNSQEKDQDDLQNLLDLINQASKQGNPEAQNFLGFVYGKGEGIAQDQKKALQFYKKASKQGNFAALLNLGSYYEGGYGGLQVNPNLSYDYYEKSALKGYINAMNKVANCLRNGKGVEKNEIEALKWEYKIAHYNEFYTHAIQWEKKHNSNQSDSPYASSDSE